MITVNFFKISTFKILKWNAHLYINVKIFCPDFLNLKVVCPFNTVDIHLTCGKEDIV